MKTALLLRDGTAYLIVDAIPLKGVVGTARVDGTTYAVASMAYDTPTLGPVSLICRACTGQYLEPSVYVGADDFHIVWSIRDPDAAMLRSLFAGPTADVFVKQGVNKIAVISAINCAAASKEAFMRQYRLDGGYVIHIVEPGADCTALDRRILTHHCTEVREGAPVVIGDGHNSIWS